MHGGEPLEELLNWPREPVICRHAVYVERVAAALGACQRTKECGAWRIDFIRPIYHGHTLPLLLEIRVLKRETVHVGVPLHGVQGALGIIVEVSPFVVVAKRNVQVGMALGMRAPLMRVQASEVRREFLEPFGAPVHKVLVPEDDDAALRDVERHLVLLLVCEPAQLDAAHFGADVGRHVLAVGNRREKGLLLWVGARGDIDVLVWGEGWFGRECDVWEEVFVLVVLFGVVVLGLHRDLGWSFGLDGHLLESWQEGEIFGCVSLGLQ